MLLYRHGGHVTELAVVTSPATLGSRASLPTTLRVGSSHSQLTWLGSM